MWSLVRHDAGEREKPLRQRLQRIRREMPDPTPEPSAKPQAALEVTDPSQPTGAAPLPSGELLSTPVKQEAAAAAQQQDDAPAAKQEDAAASKQEEAAPVKQEGAAGVKQEDSPMPDAGELHIYVAAQCDHICICRPECGTLVLRG